GGKNSDSDTESRRKPPNSALVTCRAPSRNSSIQTRCTGFSLSCPVSQPIRNHPAEIQTSARTDSSARDGESEEESSCVGCVGSVGSIASKRPQCADDVFDFILLKEADAGDPGCSSLQARCGVFHRDATESEEGDLRPARLMQGGEARRLPSGSIVFFEDRAKDG